MAAFLGTPVCAACGLPTEGDAFGLLLEASQAHGGGASCRVYPRVESAWVTFDDCSTRFDCAAAILRACCLSPRRVLFRP